MTETLRSIGVIGAGEMGGRMARRLAASGHGVAICDVDQATLAAFAADGFPCSTLPKDVAGGDIVIVMVANDAQMLALTGGPDGLLDGLDPAKSPIILVMSTCRPSTVLAVRDMVAARNARVVEAPVSGGLVGAESGTLSVLLGGADADIDEVMPVVRCVGQNLFNCGPLGAAQITKLINNMIGLTNLYLVSEAFDIARRSGVDLEKALPAIDASAGRSFLSRDLERSRRQFADWSSSPEAFEALSRIIRKDISLVGEVASEAGVDAQVLRSVSGVLGAPSEAVYQRLRALAGMTSNT